MSRTKSPLNRALKQVKKREVQKLNHHLEKLGAAFVKETGLKPSDCALVQRDNEDGTKEYAFAPRVWNPANLSEEVRDLFNICFDLGRATTDEEKEKGLDLLRAFLKGLADEQEPRAPVD